MKKINPQNPVLGKIKGKKIALFVDNANWFYSQKELGSWEMRKNYHIFLEEIKNEIEQKT